MSSAQPQAVEYGADEISALVLDPGHSVVRAGFAGEDAPKSVVPSYYGVLESSAADKIRYVFDDSAINNPFSNIDVRNPMASDGTVEDWDVAVKLWEYAITSRLTVPRQRRIEEPTDGASNGEIDVRMEEVEGFEKPLGESPLLMTEPNHNPLKNREKSIEIAMEDWGCPAFFLQSNGVLAAFASGRPSALVVDVGASTTSVAAMHEGMILRKSIQRSPLAGNWVNKQLRLMFSQSTPPLQLRPHYQVLSKSPVDAGNAAQFIPRNFTTPRKPTFHHLQEERLLSEFKESCVQIWNPHVNNEQPLSNSLDYIKLQNQDRPFEFPDGSNNVFGIDRFRVAEGLFDTKSAYSDASNPAPEAKHSIQALCAAALAPLDVDLRMQLLNNIVSTGGSTIIQGFNDRLHYELSNQYQGTRVRIHSPGNLYERKFGPWIGGSILSSLGSFHQMWISKKEYDEVGPNIVEKRCK